MPDGDIKVCWYRWCLCLSVVLVSRSVASLLRSISANLLLRLFISYYTRSDWCEVVAACRRHSTCTHNLCPCPCPQLCPCSVLLRTFGEGIRGNWALRYTIIGFTFFCHFLSGSPFTPSLLRNSSAHSVSRCKALY